MGLKANLRWLGSACLLGLVVWIMTINLAIAPVQAAIRQIEEVPGQMVYQSRQTLNDQQGSSWQVIAFKRNRPDQTATLYPTFRTLKCHTQVLTLQAFEFKGSNA